MFAHKSILILIIHIVIYVCPSFYFFSLIFHLLVYSFLDIVLSLLYNIQVDIEYTKNFSLYQSISLIFLCPPHNNRYEIFLLRVGLNS